MSYIESKIISLNASDATTNNSTYLSNLDFLTNKLYMETDDVINTYIEITNAQIPVSFYIINYTNNIYKFSIGAVIETHIVPVGNYNATQLITLLNTYHSNFVATFDKITGKITWSHNQSFIIYNNFNYSIGTILGFNPDTINTSVGSSNPYTLTTPNLLNLMGIKKLNIFSGDLELNNYSSSNNNQLLYSGLIGSIPVDATTYGLINYHNYSNIKTPINNKNIDYINIQVKDETNNYINFNGVSFCITLVLHIEKKYKNLTNIDFYDAVKPKEEPKQESNKQPEPKNLSELDLLTQ